MNYKNDKTNDEIYHWKWQQVYLNTSDETSLCIFGIEQGLHEHYYNYPKVIGICNTLEHHENTW